MSFDQAKPAIHAQNLGKQYVLGASPYQRLWQLLVGSSSNLSHFNALSGVDINIAQGESIGIIGQNGAGKSTLLQLLCGTLTPSTGQLEVNGQVAALLELGAGFNQDFTGRENILFSAALYGMQAQHIEQHLQEIIDFADIGEFIDQPVRTYSSGMYVRLAFAIATSVQPDILVIDEALSVGDGAFARKSFDRIMQLKQSGVTLLFCSHSLFQVESLCSRCIWLHQGQVMAQGPSAEVIAKYNDWLSQQAVAKAPIIRNDQGTVAGLTADATSDGSSGAASSPELDPKPPQLQRLCRQRSLHQPQSPLRRPWRHSLNGPQRTKPVKCRLRIHGRPAAAHSQFGFGGLQRRRQNCVQHRHLDRWHQPHQRRRWHWACVA
jgi:ABC-type polysaccharide/polyol phosphate transport system ATPase subunit